MRALALALVLGGCFVPSPNEKESLEEQVRTWHEDVRWERWQQASMRLPPGQRKRFLEQTRALDDDIEMSNYEILAVQNGGNGRAEVRTALEWLSKNTGLLRKTELTEVWMRAGNEWILAETRHDRGEKLPFFQPPDSQK